MTAWSTGPTCDTREVSEFESEDYDFDSGISPRATKKKPVMTRMIREGTTIIINASQKHTASVILSHGLGDTADGWADAAMEMSKRLPHIRWVLPTAPSNPVSLNGGMRMPSWYNIASLSSSRAHQACEGIDESTATLIGLIEKEKTAGIDYSRIVLAGFSQGGAMSLWAGLQFAASHSHRLAGIVCLSGYLPKDHAFVLSEHGKNTPVLHCHGSADPLVLPSFAEESHKHILQAGHSAGYDMKVYPGLAHSATMQELNDVANWLALLQTNAATGEWALQRLLIRYSETGGSSLGFRFYLRNLLESWKVKNPQVEVVTAHSQFENPRVTAEWIGGEKHETSMANLRPKQIENLLNFYRNSQGANLYLRHGGPRCWTERRSVQGLWQPSLESSLKSLKWFHRPTSRNTQTLRYSPSSIQRAADHYNGVTSGRWGGNELHGTRVDVGFSKDRMNSIFSQPFV